jgi:hypothetical protein
VGALLGVHDRVGADDEPVDPVPPNLPRHDRSFAAGAVVDAESLVVGTNGGCRYTGVHECDALVWRVTATGSVPVAGRISPFTPVKDDSGRWFRPVLKDPAQDLPVGWSVPAGEVDLPNVSAILPLPGGRILLIAGGSDDSFSPVPGRLWAFVVEGDRIRRLATPATMSAVSQVGLSQVSGGRGLLTTPSVDEKNTEGHWLIDPGAGATRPVVPVGGSVVGNGSDRYVKATLDGDAHRVTLTSWPVPPGG